jgi:hypothetical protein
MFTRSRLTRQSAAPAVRSLVLTAGLLASGALVVTAGPASAAGRPALRPVSRLCSATVLGRVPGRVVCVRQVRCPILLPFLWQLTPVPTPVPLICTTILPLREPCPVVLPAFRHLILPAGRPGRPRVPVARPQVPVALPAGRPGIRPVRARPAGPLRVLCMERLPAAAGGGSGFRQAAPPAAP